MARVWSEQIKDIALIILIINFLGDIIFKVIHIRRPPTRPPFGLRMTNNGYDTNRMEILETRVDDLEIRVMEVNYP